jgi:hypothetical protein
MLTRLRTHRRRLAIPLAVASVAITAAATLTLSAAPATAGAPAEALDPVDCQILLGKAASPATPSPVLSTKCVRSGQPLAAPRANTLLMVWYDYYGYKGASTKIYGTAGPCDSQGYGFAWVGSTWNDRIRSYKVFNYCTYSSAFQHINWGGYCHEYSGQVPDASAMDAEISSLWISRGTYAWQLC